MTPFVRGGADARAQGGREDHLRHLLAGLRAAELRRPADRAGRRPGDHRRLDAAEGRHRDQDGAEHADDRRDDQGRQDLRQPDGRRADRIREAEGPRPAHPRHRHRHRLRRPPTRCSSAPKWNVKAAIVMQKTGLTLPQALRRLKKADDSVREAIGEDVEPRLRELLQLAAVAASAARPSRPHARTGAAGCLVEPRVDVGVQLEERRRQLRRDRPVDQPLDARRLRLARSRAGRSTAREGSSPSPSTALRAARARISAEQRRVAAPGLGLERHPMRARLQRRRRLVEADVAVGADAEDLQVDAAGRARSPARSARTPPRDRRRRAVEKVDLRRRRGSRG